MGGFAALYCSINHDEITNVASFAGFNSGAFGEILEKNKMIYDYSTETIQPAIQLVSGTTAEKLLNEYISKKNEWNLLNHMEKLSGKNLLLIGAKYDMIAPIDLHHKPLVEQLESRKSKLESYILETGHSFSDGRIKLSKLISGWLYKIII